MKAAGLPLLLTLGRSGRLVAVTPGLLAAAASVFAGAPTWASILAALLFLVPLVTARLAATLALLAASVLLATQLPLRSLAELDAVLPVLVMMAAGLPFFLHLGGAYPGRLLVFYVATPVLALALLHVAAPLDWRLLVDASDVSTRAQLLLVLVTVAAVDLAMWIVRRRADAKRDAQE